MGKKYAVVTAVSTFRMRYVIPVDDLQAMVKDDLTIDDDMAISWAYDSVTCEDVLDFSQKHLGEHIVGGEVLSEEEVLQLFDKDNDYLKDWSVEKKLKQIHNWRDTWKEKQQEKAVKEFIDELKEDVK
jgi:hypothetical protein